jgi:hypothetical protein
MTIRSPKRSALPHAESSSADTSRKNNLPDASVMGGNYLVQVLRVQACSKDPQAHQTANHNCQMPAFGLTHAHRQLTGCRRWRDRRALIARPQWAAMENTRLGISKIGALDSGQSVSRMSPAGRAMRERWGWDVLWSRARCAQPLSYRCRRARWLLAHRLIRSIIVVTRPKGCRAVSQGGRGKRFDQQA